MKMTQIFLGLILASTIYLMGKYSVTVPELGKPVFLFIIVLLTILLSFFAYRMKKDMKKMQKTIDNLTAELKRTKDDLEEKINPLKSMQQAINTKGEKIQWDELDQAEKDAHIANIQKSMEYTGSNTSSEQRTGDTHDIVQAGTYYEENIDTYRI